MKKILLLLLGLFALSPTVLAGSKPYTDGFISESVYQTKEWGIFSGYSDGSFQAYEEMNRAELSKVLVLAALEESEVEACAEETEWNFSDVPEDEWYTNYVYCAKAKGWVKGDDGKTTFRPGDPVLMGETFKMIVESQYGTPSTEYNGDEWYDLYRNFLANYQIIDLWTTYSSDTVYHVYGYLWISYDDDYVGFDSDSLASKMMRIDIAELLFRMRKVFMEGDGEPYDLAYSFEEMEALYGTSFTFEDETLAVDDPHFGFRFENLPLEKLDVDEEDWRVYVADPSAFENGGNTSWYLIYPTGEEIGHYSGYEDYFHISISDSTYIHTQYDFENNEGQTYLWWCPQGYGTTVEEILADACMVDLEQNLDAEYVNFSAY